MPYTSEIRMAGTPRSWGNCSISSRAGACFLRPVLACRWIQHRHSAPPVAFGALSDSMLPAELRETVENAAAELRGRILSALHDRLRADPQNRILHSMDSLELGDSDFAVIIS